MTLALGIVADDLTGACDVAEAATDAGLATVVSIGAPSRVPAADCVVVALKSRTADPDVAVADSVASARRLLDAGAERLYQKYCSTFDSTDSGNIGPVAEALADLVSPERPVSVGTPATPSVGRTQYLGHLFVGDRLLSESSLRDHPLTPMRDPDLVRVLGRQATRAVSLVPHAIVRRGADAVRAAIGSTASGHVLLDALDESDLEVLAEAVGGGGVLIGGGAGLAGAVARRLAAGSAPAALPSLGDAQGPRLILSGSTSERTREQVAAFRGRVLRVSPQDLAASGATALVAEVEAALRDEAVLVSATDEPHAVRAAQDALGRERASALVEAALAEVAVAAVDRMGVRRLIVAGGETSGAVAAALGVTLLRVGRSAAPGVPWMLGERDGTRLALLLKSGNFGSPELFSTAWESAP